MDRDSIDSVLRSLRRVNLQGSFLGQSVAVRFGLSESDIETLEQLMDMGATSAGRLSEITGLTSGAVTRVIDRLEQSGYVRRVPDPTDRRRVIVEIVPEKVASIESTLSRVSTAGAKEISRYTDAQLALIGDFLTRMEEVTRSEAASLRETPQSGPDGGPASSEHSAPLGGLREARLAVRSGMSLARLRAGLTATELYRAEFEGVTPQVRVRDGRVLVQYRRAGFDWRKRSATFGLNTTIPWTVELIGGVQRLEADLRSVDLRSLSVTGGVEKALVEVGRTSGDVPLSFVGGVVTLRLARPAAVPVRLSIVGGAVDVTLDGTHLGRKAGESALESAGWTAAGDRLDVTIVGGSKTIEIVQRG